MKPQRMTQFDLKDGADRVTDGPHAVGASRSGGKVTAEFEEIQEALLFIAEKIIAGEDYLLPIFERLQNEVHALEYKQNLRSQAMNVVAAAKTSNGAKGIVRKVER